MKRVFTTYDTHFYLYANQMWSTKTLKTKRKLKNTYWVLSMTAHRLLMSIFTDTQKAVTPCVAELWWLRGLDYLPLPGMQGFTLLVGQLHTCFKTWKWIWPRRGQDYLSFNTPHLAVFSNDNMPRLAAPEFHSFLDGIADCLAIMKMKTAKPRVALPLNLLMPLAWYDLPLDWSDIVFPDAAGTQCIPWSCCPNSV